MDVKTRILEELKGNSRYISGQELCEKYNVSRTSIWKVINQLRQEGYQIDSAQNRGYKIISYPDILSSSEIKSALKPGSIIEEVLYFDQLDSTNTRAKLLGEQGCSSGTLVVADSQNNGKGRRGKGFDSPKGESIYMTALFKPDIPPIKASMITIVAAMAVNSALVEICNIPSKIKWPNDIVVDNKKICGILTEMSTDTDIINYVVVGIGINVNNPNMPDELKDVAVSVRMASGKKYRRSTIISSVMDYFQIYYDKFLKTQDLSLIKDEYNKILIHYNKEIEVIRGQEKYKAISLGIDNDGELLIEKDGNCEKIISGEVSVRGVYGYV